MATSSRLLRERSLPADEGGRRFAFLVMEWVYGDPVAAERPEDVDPAATLAFREHIKTRPMDERWWRVAYGTAFRVWEIGYRRHRMTAILFGDREEDPF